MGLAAVHRPKGRGEDYQNGRRCPRCPKGPGSVCLPSLAFPTRQPLGLQEGQPVLRPRGCRKPRPVSTLTWKPLLGSPLTLSGLRAQGKLTSESPVLGPREPGVSQVRAVGCWA